MKKPLKSLTTPPALADWLFPPGMRVAIAVSAGADSVALLRTMLVEQGRLGLVLSVVHVHHGIRGSEADGDAAFVEELARQFSLPFHQDRVDAPAAALAKRETIEEAARNLRYACFWQLIEQGGLDAVATAHTLDDQAETVLHRLLRGAWTEGLSGIHPALRKHANSVPGGPRERSPGGDLAGGSWRGAILRPFLGVRRAEIEAWLGAIGQQWREDATNHDQKHTRNRLRHSLLPELATFNPQVATQLAHLATLARDDEDYWQAELARTLPSLLLPGKAARGGGRATSTDPTHASVAMESERLRVLHPALRRRVLRAAAQHMGVSIDFAQTDQLLGLCFALSPPSRGKGVEVGGDLVVERSAREIRLVRRQQLGEDRPEAYTLPVPGEVSAVEFGLRFRAELERCGWHTVDQGLAIVRGCRAGDRVRLRHSRGPRSIKEVFERLKVEGIDRVRWPLVEWQGEIVWMQGADVESAIADAAGLKIIAEEMEEAASSPAGAE